MYLIKCILGLILYAGCVFTKSIKDDLIVELPEGKIQGHVLKSFNGNDYYAFQEIPYAAPPIGENRYKLPKNPEPWTGILDATKNTKQCIQDMELSQMNTTEDCLYVNVYTPQIAENNTLLPVLVFVHGGGFMEGSGVFDMNNPKRFMDYGIIVVTINYRLGAFGFLTTMDNIIPGNLGLKDQQFSFKWVNKNIHLFGGDPNKVTISGQSAGSFSISYQLLGQNSKGLFRGAIQESGSSLYQGVYSTHAREYAFELGRNLDATFTSNKSEDLLELLKSASVSDIVAANKKVKQIDENTDGILTSPIWVPVLESKYEEGALIVKNMHEAFMDGEFNQVPTLIGYNSEEALGFIDETRYSIASDYDKDPSLMINEKFNVDEKNKVLVGTQLKSIYTDSFADDHAAFIKYSSDAVFTTAALRQAEVSSKYITVYFYQFSYMGKLGEYNSNGSRPTVPGVKGVGHGEELAYLWECPYDGTIPDSDALIVKRMLTMWTNFVKYLNPTPEKDEILENIVWPTVSSDGIQYLNINSTMEVQSLPRHYGEVSKLLQEYFQPPFIVF